MIICSTIQVLRTITGGRNSNVPIEEISLVRRTCSVILGGATIVIVFIVFTFKIVQV
jgi:hypothetical protein